MTNIYSTPLAAVSSAEITFLQHLLTRTYENFQEYAHVLDATVRFTACAVATSCCISDVPFQWEGRNFDPPQLPHFSFDLSEIQN